MKIFIWGTGRLAGKVVGNCIALNKIEGFIDNNKCKNEYMGKKVITPEELKDIDYDAVLVANLFSREIYNQCCELRLHTDEFIFLYENFVVQDLNTDYGFISKILGNQYADIVKKRYHVIRGVEEKENLCLNDWDNFNGSYQEHDYVRMKCFELAVREIRKNVLGGGVAEAGVFRGEFAQFINYAFPDRKLYLFDTFDGFDQNESINEVKQGNCTDAFVEAYKQTNIKMVLSRMKYPDNVIIKQGLFPESLDGLEEEFAFVSLDMDFEESIYAGLEYFYPRLLKGGYIFIHDYSSSLQGVEAAVNKYERNLGTRLCKVALCDANGTLVVTK